MPLLEQVLKKNPNTVKLAFKNFPLRNHKFAKKAALAAMAAGEQGKFWEFHDLLFANYNKLSDQKIDDIAKQMGLDMDKFRRAMNDARKEQLIGRDMQDGIQAGVRGTPTIFINGRLLKNRSPQGFQAVIDSELKKAKTSSN